MVYMMKRLIWILGFIPVTLLSGIKWVLIGGPNSLDLLDAFEKWTSNDPGF